MHKKLMYATSSPWFLPIVICLIVLTCAYVPQAQGQEVPTCYDYEAVLKIAEDRGQAPIGAGVTHGGALIIILANPDTGEWTMLIRGPQNCVLIPAEGFGWDTATTVTTGNPA